MLPNKYKIGQRVKVIKRRNLWQYGSYEINWLGEMDSTIGKIYTVIGISDMGYQLNTKLMSVHYRRPYDYWYPEESLIMPINYQLEFSFMEGE